MHGHVLALELVGPNARELLTYGYMIAWALSYMALSVVAYFIRDRLWLQLVSAVPCLLLVPCLWLVLAVWSICV